MRHHEQSEYYPSGHAQALLREKLASGELRSYRNEGWSTEADPSEAFRGLEGVEFSYRGGPRSRAAFLGTHAGAPDWCAAVTYNHGTVSLEVAATIDDDADAAFAELAARFPRVQTVAGEPRVPITFWTHSPHGPTSRRRLVDVPGWEQVRDNYAATTLAGLAPLMTGFEPAAGGQLLLWQGPPGTGKTWCLRALAWEWRDWCSLHYIVDPDTFFGDSPSYMLDVLLHDDGSDAPVPVDEPGGSGGTGGRGRERWRLLVLEDTGELLAADAKARTGQALSRLLNVVDGLIGQGLRVLVLVTTNDELKALHPAVSRPGRCASRVTFAPFDAVGADEWRQLNGVPFETSGSATLADLFAERAGRLAPVSNGVGFRA